jgi:nitrogen-specific signal transduction histidine kinase
MSMTNAVIDNAVSSGSVCLPSNSKPATFFAPAGRDEPDEFRRKRRTVRNTPFLQQALDAMPNLVVILNDNRQVVAASETLLTMLDTAIDNLLGKRSGELVGCIRAKEGPDGCGTARHCMSCGMVSAVIESRERGQKVVRECRIVLDTPTGVTPLDLRVTAVPFVIDEDHFLMVTIEDTSQPKRLAVLQRIFFHDVLNTAGCLQGYARYLLDEVSDQQDVYQRMSCLADQLVEAIQSQRDLVHAEAGELKMQPVSMRASQVLEELRSQYQKHPIAEGRAIEVQTTWDGTVVSDRQLLHRVLGNMLKNALEATSPGNTVRIDCQEHGQEVVFGVHNAEVMPEEVQLQVFQRSFSTKEQPGRGIGTYSMKLLGERYLEGKVGFSSQPSKGTTFWLAIPERLN